MARKGKKKTYTGTQPQLTRLHGIVERIQKGDLPNRRTLALEWEKSVRTIQSDLDFIRDVWGLPLEYDDKNYGFYFTESVAKFPMVSISEKELVSVFIAQKALTQYHGTPFEQPLKSAFEKLVGGLHGEITVAWEDLDSAISFRGIEANAGDMEVLQQLSGAVRNHFEIEFGYTKLEEGSESTAENAEPKAASAETRRVRPYHMANIGNQWYLFGYDLMRKDMRRFVPARMSELRVTEQKFVRPKNFSLDKFLKGSFGVFSGGETKEMKVKVGRARAQLMRERKWHHSQKVHELGNGEIEVTYELSSLVEIVPWILGWGEHAQAISPKGLVDEVARVVKKLGVVYGNSGEPQSAVSSA